MTEEEFTQFFRANYDKQVIKIRRIMGGDHATASDVVSEAYTRAWKRKSKFNPDLGEFEKWFNSILYNTMRDIIKDLADIDFIDEPVEREKNMIHAIARIDNPEHRRILELNLIQGYKEKEIMKLIGPSYKSGDIRKIVYRFKGRLREDADRYGLRG